MTNKPPSADELRQIEKRVNQRLSLAAHYMNAGVISWDREGYSSVLKLGMKSLLMADVLLELNDKFPEGSIDPSTI